MKVVTFGLGQAVGLASRRVIITRATTASDDYNKPAAYYVESLAGDTESVDITLPDNQLWQATLRDYKTTGEASRIDVLNFHTGSLQFPGPKSGDRLCILSMEDMSSSSSSSVSSISTSSSSTSTSSQSASSSSSSISTSSQSSLSLSSSSISTSSQSASSLSSSSISTSSQSESSQSSSSVSISESSQSASSQSASSVSSASSSSSSSGLPA